MIRIQEIRLPSDPVSQFIRAMEQNGSASLNLSGIEERKANEIYNYCMGWAEHHAKRTGQDIQVTVRVEQ